MNKEKVPTIENSEEDQFKKQERGVDRSRMSEKYGLSDSSEQSQPPGSTEPSIANQAKLETNEYGIGMTESKDWLRQEIASRINEGETDFEVDQFIIREHGDIQAEVDSLPEIANKPGEYPVIQSQQELSELYLEAFEDDLSFVPEYVPSDDVVEDERRRLVDKKTKEVLEAQKKYNQEYARKTAEAVRKDQLNKFQKVLKEKKDAGKDIKVAEQLYQQALADNAIRVDEEKDLEALENNK